MAIGSPPLGTASGTPIASPAREPKDPPHFEDLLLVASNILQDMRSGITQHYWTALSEALSRARGLIPHTHLTGSSTPGQPMFPWATIYDCNQVQKHLGDELVAAGHLPVLPWASYLYAPPAGSQIPGRGATPWDALRDMLNKNADQLG